VVVRRGALFGLGAFGPAVAGLVAAAVLAGPVAGARTATTGAAPTIAPGVTIAGLSVAYMTYTEAYDAVDRFFSRPLAVVVARHRQAVAPAEIGGSADVNAAVADALVAAPGTAVALAVQINRSRTRAYVASLAKRFDTKPVDSQLYLRRLRPVVTKERPGRKLDRPAAVRILVRAIATHRRGPLLLRQRAVAPKVTQLSYGPVIVIRRGSNRLYLYRGMRLGRVFPVATGQRSYPTPLGKFSVVVKWRNPWWYPPSSPWARGQHPIPPGPGNPLGTRWMGLSAPGVGIHGTPDSASIGYSASHGCIRMRIPDAEWLFVRVKIGTQVFIVAA
jgi:lipoprotein-anchoring transpeptidase ErfK/SrfK